MANFMTWAAQQELESIRTRTKAGLNRARAEGKTLGRPAKMTPYQVEVANRMRLLGKSWRQIGRELTEMGVSVSGETVRRYLSE